MSTKRASSFTWQEPVQRWLFVGTLLFATLAVPSIALLTRGMIDPPVHHGGGSSAGGQIVTPSLGGAGGASCTPTLTGLDSVMIKDCPLSL